MNKNAELTDKELADAVRCGINHSGNNRLARHFPGWFQCQGCGHLYTDGEIEFALKHPRLVPAHLVMVDTPELKKKECHS